MITDFTPVSGAIGGALIGIAAVVLLAANGRVAGVSGILGGAILDRPVGDIAWRIAFLGGLLLGALLFAAWSPSGLVVQFQTGWVGTVAAGVLVGFGTRMGSGCTSGHGVCGLARFSRRSLVATATFMAAGMVTVYLLRHVLKVAS